jgi:hypothetical protein
MFFMMYQKRYRIPTEGIKVMMAGQTWSMAFPPGLRAGSFHRARGAPVGALCPFVQG